MLYSRFVNGVAVRTGHRFRTTHDFGYVALDILYTYPEDSGTYMCKATNLAGEAVNTCTIKVGCKYFISITVLFLKNLLNPLSISMISKIE